MTTQTHDNTFNPRKVDVEMIPCAVAFIVWYTCLDY